MCAALDEQALDRSVDRRALRGEQQGRRRRLNLVVNVCVNNKIKEKKIKDTMSRRAGVGAMSAESSE